MDFHHYWEGHLEFVVIFSYNVSGPKNNLQMSRFNRWYLEFCNRMSQILPSESAHLQRLSRTSVHIWPSSSSSPDSVEDELELSAVRHRPEGLEQLEAQTRFSRKELQILYRGFKNVSEGATMHNVQLSRLCSLLNIKKHVFHWLYLTYSFFSRPFFSWQGC